MDVYFEGVSTSTAGKLHPFWASQYGGIVAGTAPAGRSIPIQCYGPWWFRQPMGLPQWLDGLYPLNKQFAIENCPVEIVEKNPAIKYGWIFHGYVSEILPEGNVT